MHPDLGREQAYFDRARALRDRRRAEAEADDFGSGAGTVGQLGRLLAPFPQAKPDEAVAFGRIDAEGDSFYIGRDAVWDDDDEMVVVNWQAPIAAPFYRATTDQPEGLAARRVYRCADDRILDIDEVVFEGLAAAAATGGEPVVSDALLDALDADRAGELHDIVATIQQAQYDVITQPIDQLLVVQGGPGTGKTQIGLHRVSWLLHNHAERLGPGDVLVVGPNPAFVRYIAAVLPALGEQATVQQPITALGPPVRIGRTDPPELRRLKGDRRMLRVIVNGLRNLQQVDDDPVELAIGRRTVRLEGARVAARARQLSTRTHNEAHRELRSFLLDEVRTRLASRGGPDPNVDSAARADATEAVDDYLYDAWPTLTPQAYLLDLLADPDQLEDAAAGLLTDDEMDLLAIPEDARVGVWQWSAHDVPMLDAADVLLNGAPASYEHIVVDEAQDLSPMQLEAIRRRSRTGSMTLLGDLAQGTSPWARTSWEDVALHLRRDRVPTRTVELRAAYRLPAEVHEVAMRLLPVIAPNLTPPEPVRPTGHGVLVARSHDLASATVETVRTLAGGKAGLAAGSAGGAAGRDSTSETGGLVGVIVPARHRARVAAGMERAGLPWAPELRGGRAPIVLLSADAAKGLEFDNVVVVEPSQIMAESERGLRSLFIAMTRCTQRLALVHRDPLPAELGTIDPAPPARPAPSPRRAPGRADAAPASAPARAGAPQGPAALEPVVADTPGPDDAGGPASERVGDLAGAAADDAPVGRVAAASPAPEAAGARGRTAEEQNEDLSALLADIRAASPGPGAPTAGGDATAGHAASPRPAPDFGTPEVPLRWAAATADATEPSRSPAGAPSADVGSPARPPGVERSADVASSAAPAVSPAAEPQADAPVSAKPAAASPIGPAADGPVGDLPEFTGPRTSDAPRPAESPVSVGDRPPHERPAAPGHRAPPATAAEAQAPAAPASGPGPAPGPGSSGGPAVPRPSAGAGWRSAAPAGNDDFDPRETMPMGMAALDTGSLTAVPGPAPDPPVPPPPPAAPIARPSQPDPGPAAPPRPAPGAWAATPGTPSDAGAAVPPAPAGGQPGRWARPHPVTGEVPASPGTPPPVEPPAASSQARPWPPPRPATGEVPAWPQQAAPPAPAAPGPWGRPVAATGEGPAWPQDVAPTVPAAGRDDDGAPPAVPRRPVTADGSWDRGEPPARADLAQDAAGPPVVEAGQVPDAYQRRFGDRRRYGDDRLAPGRPPEAPADPSGPSSSPYGAPRPAPAAVPPPSPSPPSGVPRMSGTPDAPGGAAPPTRTDGPATGARQDGHGEPAIGHGEPAIGHGPLWASSPGQTAELRLAAGLHEQAPAPRPTRPGLRDRVADGPGATPGPRLGNRLPAGAPSWLRGAGEPPGEDAVGDGTTPAARTSDEARRGPVAYGTGRRGGAGAGGDDAGERSATTGDPAAAPAGADARPQESGGTRSGMPAAPGAGQGGAADRTGWSPAVGGAYGADPARPPAGGPATVDDQWSKEALGHVDSIQVNGGTDRAPVDDAVPAWGAGFPEISPAAADWRTSIPREFVARAPGGAPRRPAGAERRDPDGPEADDRPANGHSYLVAGSGYVPAGSADAEAPAIEAPGAAVDPGVGQAAAGPGGEPVPGGTASPRPYEPGARARQDAATAQATQANQPSPPGPPPGQGHDPEDRPSLYSHGAASAPGYDRLAAPAPDRAGRTGGEDRVDPRPVDRPVRPAAAEPTVIPRVPYSSRPATGPVAARPAASRPAPAATATRVNGAPGVNGVTGGRGPGATGHELVLAEPDPEAGGGTTGASGTAGGLRPVDASGPWNELDREIARAVAATLAGKLARYVNPNLLPLVAEELGRNISPDAPRPAEPGGPSGARPS